MTPIQVVGIGLEGAAGLAPALVNLVNSAQVLVGAIAISAISLTIWAIAGPWGI